MTRKERQMLKLTTFTDGETVLVNPEKIQTVYAYGDGTQINFDHSCVKVKEDILEIMQMIVDDKFKKGE